MTTLLQTPPQQCLHFFVAPLSYFLATEGTEVLWKEEGIGFIPMYYTKSNNIIGFLVMKVVIEVCHKSTANIPPNNIFFFTVCNIKQLKRYF